MNCVIYPDGTREQITYNEAGYSASITDREGNICRYSHDRAGRLTSYISPEGRTTSYEYSDAGSLLCITDADGTIRYTYDSSGNQIGRAHV